MLWWRSRSMMKGERSAEAAGRQVIIGGVEPGELVVSVGAYMVKAELLLQNAPEED